MQPPTSLAPRLSTRDRWAAAILAAIAFAVFARSIFHGLITLDDPYYVFLNPNVLAGLNADTIAWAFTTFDNTNWHPLTWLSLELDTTVWGQVPWGYHLTNVLLHTANTALLFIVLRTMTGAFLRSAAVALIFAVHPLRVESVAWVTERKDVLSAFFGFLALWAYATYVATPSLRRYLAVVLAMAFSLMAKPMLVTLPFLLLVLDWWPLHRARGGRDWIPLIAEKLPLVGLAAASSAITWWVQSEQGAVAGLERYPVDVRLANSAISYVQYLSKTFWPVGLAVYYPHPGASLPLWKVIGAASLLGIVSASAVALRRRAPYLLAGWLWFLGTLVPVIGLVQVGQQAFADRYSYIPQIGILIMICWGIAEFSRLYVPAASAALAVTAVVLTIVTEKQIDVWRDSVTLWEHTIRTAGRSPTALQSLARALEDVGGSEALEKARHYYEESLQLDSESHLGNTNLGTLLSRLGKLDEAAEYLKKACALGPKAATAHSELGYLYFKQGKYKEAMEEQQKAIELAPKYSIPHSRMGQVMAALGHPDEAIDHYLEALHFAPNFADARVAIAKILLSQGKKDEALEHLNAAIAANPHSGEAHYLLGKELLTEGDKNAALAQYHEAVINGPVPWDAYFEVGKEMEEKGEIKAAEMQYNEAVHFNDKADEALFRLGRILLSKGEVDEAEKCLEEAVKCKPDSSDYKTELARLLDAKAAQVAVEGNPSEAMRIASRALQLAESAKNTDLTRMILDQLNLYKRGETGRPSSKIVP